MKLFPDRRDDPRERRRRLRRLDAVLLDSIDFYVSVTFDELVADIATSPGTRGLALSDATLREWWADTDRRRLLEPVDTHAGRRWALADRGTVGSHRCARRERSTIARFCGRSDG